MLLKFNKVEKTNYLKLYKNGEPSYSNLVFIHIQILFTIFFSSLVLNFDIFGKFDHLFYPDTFSHT